jgi:hypothetical protein
MPTVRRENSTATEAESWSFSCIASELTLWSWKRETRKSKRHVWRVEKHWDSSYSGPRYGNPARPHIPVDVAQEAKRVFVEALKVEGEEAVPVQPTEAAR